MNIKTKKIIAREVLILSITVVMIILFYGGTYLYNKSVEKEVQQLKDEIHTGWLKAKALRTAYETKREQRLVLLTEFRKIYEVDDREFDDVIWARLYDLTKKDSLQARWNNNWTDEHKQPFINMGFNPDSIKSFVLRYSYTRKDIEDYNKGAEIYTTELPPLKNKEYYKRFDILSHSKRVDYTQSFALYLLLAFFGLRYFYYVIRWSLQTLKAQTP